MSDADRINMLTAIVLGLMGLITEHDDLAALKRHPKFNDIMNIGAELAIDTIVGPRP